MLNGRLYRAAFVPFVFALAIAAFSLTARPSPLHSTLAPDAFEGQRAFAELTSLGAAYPDRRPGSRGDQALAAYVARTLRGLGGTAGGGFTVHTRRFSAQISLHEQIWFYADPPYVVAPKVAKIDSRSRPDLEHGPGKSRE